MILDAARRSLANLIAPETRPVVWKVIGLTLLILLALWFALRETFLLFALPWIGGYLPANAEWSGWLTFFLGLFASIGIALALAMLLGPVSALTAGFFLDDVAETVERRDYPGDPPGAALPLGTAILGTLGFLGVVILGNIVALFLLLIPGVNLVAFFLVNGYLLGREFFEFAAMRHRPPAQARLFRARHRGTVFLAGLLLAAFLAVPVLNLLTPLFAAGMMVHLHRALSQRDPQFAASLPKREIAA
ncbi:sulfate transporter family protein [Ensifer soli]|uniref:sulfate transporter family protein n=1 Tax=Ciceribacter sp. sgz301302 TaxID=3342379 RepID=UPI0035B7FA17